ncbi:hypothetical protein COOONC_28354 [Cooperia oncophora]
MEKPNVKWSDIAGLETHAKVSAQEAVIRYHQIPLLLLVAS